MARRWSSVKERLKVVAARRDSGVGSEEGVSTGNFTGAVFFWAVFTPCTFKSGVRENSSFCKRYQKNVLGLS